MVPGVLQYDWYSWEHQRIGTISGIHRLNLMRRKLTLLAVFVFAAHAKFGVPPRISQSHAVAPSLTSIREQQKALILSRDYHAVAVVSQEGYETSMRLGDEAAAARFLNSKGSAEFSTFQYVSALQSYRQTQQLALKNRDGELLAIVACNLSSLYLQQQDLNSAARAAEEGLKVVQRFAGTASGPLLIAQSAILHARQDDFDVARDLFRRAASEADARGDTATVAMVWNQLGYELLKRKEFEQAETALLEAFRLRKLNRFPDLAYSYFTLGLLRLAQGDTRSAGMLLDQAVAQIGASSATMPLWRLYAERGRARLAEGRPLEALSDLDKSLESATRLRAAFLPADTVRTAMNVDQTELYAAHIRASTDLFFKSGDAAYARRAFRTMAEAQSTALRALLHTPAEWRRRLPVQYWETLAEMSAAEGDLLGRNTTAAREKADILLYRLTEMEAQAGVDLERATSAPSDGTELTWRVREALGPEAAFIGVHLDEPNSFRWMITQETFDLQKLPSGVEIANLAEEFQRAVGSGRPEAASRGEQLYRLLFGSAPADVQRRSRWVLNLDGALLQAPVAALVTGHHAGRPNYLIEDHAVSLVPSALLFEGNGSHTYDGPFLGVADPIYNTADPRWPATRSQHRRPAWDWLPGVPRLFGGFSSRASTALARLPGSGREVLACADIWDPAASNALVLSGAGASIQRLGGTLARRPAIVHFATHFLPSAGPPPQALIALSLGRDGSPEVLSPAEISRWRYDLGTVVLSGCGSARAEILPSEGLMGMTRAWLAAGARSVVASLWPTTDDSGSMFVAFYRHLAETRGRRDAGRAADALREAQRDMLRSDDWRGQPRYWAAYFVVGKE